MITDQQIQQAIDLKTKPLGALGKLETLAAKLCQLQQTLAPEIMKPTVMVFAGDHGLANEGVSPFPQEVTWQMVMNFLQGGAAINVFANQQGLDLKVVDAGVNFNFESHPDLIDRKVSMGTASALQGPAMTPDQMTQAVTAGRQLVTDLSETGTNCICLGEMGIGNTSSAALLMSRLLNLSLDVCVGRGAGSDDSQLQKKLAVLEATNARHADINDPGAILAAVGGFEIAMMTGAILEAYKNKMIIVVDGFITTSAVIVARAMTTDGGQELLKSCVFAHCSDEQGHRLMLDALQAEPLLNLDMRLGEGSGAALAMPLVESAAAFMRDMASFESAGVSNKDNASSETS